MNIALDLIVAVIFGAIVAECVCRGFAVSVMNFAKSILSVLFAYLLSPAVAGIFSGRLFYPLITKFVADGMPSSFSDIGAGVETAACGTGQVDYLRCLTVSPDGIDLDRLDPSSIDLSKIDLSSVSRGDVEKFLSDVPEKYSEIMDKFGLDASQILEKYDALVSGGDVSFLDFISEVASPIVNTVSSACAFLTVFVLSLAVLGVVTLLLPKFVSLPTLPKGDRAIGAVVGVLSGLIVAATLSTVIVAGLETLSGLIPELFGGTAEKTVLVKLLGGAGSDSFLLK